MKCMRVNPFVFTVAIFITMFSPSHLFACDETPAIVETGEATDITTSSAVLNGTVNGEASSVWAEYGAASGAYENESLAYYLNSSDDTEVRISISDLSTDTTYYYRLIALHENITTYGVEKSFTTDEESLSVESAGPRIFIEKNDTELLCSLPEATTGAGTEVTADSALLRGIVNGGNCGLETTYYFEYGKNSGEYSNLSLSYNTNNTSDTEVSAIVYGLSDGTTYYYRIVAHNEAGKTEGEEETFTTAQSPSPTPTPVTIPSPCELSYIFIFGTVTDADTGEPVSGATVTAISSDEITSTEPDTTDSSGNYKILLYEAGNYVLVVTAEGYAAYSEEVTVDVDYDTAITVNIELIAYACCFPGTISGTVTDEDGNQIKSVKLQMKGKNTKAKIQGKTDEEGTFKFEGLAADTYKLTARKKGYRKYKQKVKLEEGAEEYLTIVLEKK